jgi:predicted DNA-binding transcriptional regulator AlpA
MSATNRAAVIDDQDEALRQIADLDISRLTRAQCAAWVAQTKSLEGRLFERLLTSDDRATLRTNGDDDRLLKITEAQQLLSVTRSWLYHHAKRLGLAVKLGDGTLRFSFLACQRFIACSTVVVPRTRGARSRFGDSV